MASGEWGGIKSPICMLNNCEWGKIFLTVVNLNNGYDREALKKLSQTEQGQRMLEEMTELMIRSLPYVSQEAETVEEK